MVVGSAGGERRWMDNGKKLRKVSRQDMWANLI